MTTITYCPTTQRDRENRVVYTSIIMANNDKVHIVTCYYFTDRRKTKAKKKNTKNMCVFVSKQKLYSLLSAHQTAELQS